MGADGWDCSLLYAVFQMLSLFFPCTATVNGGAGHNRGEVAETPPLARTQGRTVLLTCTGCAFQVTPGLEKGVTLKRATNPRTGGCHPKNWTLDSDTLAVPFFNILYGILVLFGAFMCLLCL